MGLIELVDEMRAAMAKVGPPAPTEYRVHPADWQELRRLQNAVHFDSVDSDALWAGPPMRLDGLLIVIDEEAPRLPQRAAP